MKKALLPFLLLIACLGINAQVPQGFNYQAIARNSAGNPIANATIKVKLSVLSDSNGFYGGTILPSKYIWEEEHINVKTSALGLFTVVLGNPLATRIQGSAGTFGAIPWQSGPLFIGTKIANPTNYLTLGSSQLWTVPYALVTSKSDKADAITTGKSIAVVSSDDNSSEPLFEVKRKDGQPVFVVYPDAVNVYVPPAVKGSKGGFAIGGFSGAKEETSQEYFRVTPDSVRIYINDAPTAKGSKGGFAIGGFSGAKAPTLKKNFYMNVSGTSSMDTVKGSPQILWFPNKNAFLAGNVQILWADSVGRYSTALGYRSKAMGDYSQAFGYRAIAYGDYSTSIGRKSVAGSRTGAGRGTSLASNAFAFGYAAQALGNGSYAFGNSSKTTSTGADSYAFGSGAIASGINSFAFGSASIDTVTMLPTTTPTRATGNYSTAIGMGAQGQGLSSIALGVGSVAGGSYSATLGSYVTANGPYSLAIGYRSSTSTGGNYSTAIGYLSSATNYYSHSFGFKASAGGRGSLSMGYYSKATTDYSTALGYYAKTTGTYASAFGNYALAVGSSSMALGVHATASGETSTALGYYASTAAAATYATAIGYNATASGNTAMSIGYASQATVQNAVAFGNSNISNGNYAVTLGNSNTAGTAANAIALGNSNLSSGANSVSLGNSNTSSGSQSIAIGTSSTSSNTNTTAIGYYAQATGVKSVSIGANYTKNIFIKPLIPIIRPPIIFPKSGTGDPDEPDPKHLPAEGDGSKGFIIINPNINRNNIAEDEYSLAVGNGNYSSNGGITFGVYNNASAQFATSIGFGNYATAANSFAAGYANSAEGEFSVAFGRYTVAKSENSFVIGRYNVETGTTDTWVDGEPLFQIGNGSSSSATHDALRVLKNGGTYIWGTSATYGLYVANDGTYGQYINSTGKYGQNIRHESDYSSGYVYGSRSYTYSSAGMITYSGYHYGGSATATNYLGFYTDKMAGKSSDVAEYIYDTNGNTQPADVVVADPGKKESIIKSSKPYQSGVVGVISTNPQLTMGMEIVMDEATGDMKKDVKAARLALTGRVPVKVCGENGAIQPGDYLTTSSQPGVAMKWTLLDVNSAKDFAELKSILSENERRRNSIIGKSVDSFSGSGTGKIIVLISLQ